MGWVLRRPFLSLLVSSAQRSTRRREEPRPLLLLLLFLPLLPRSISCFVLFRFLTLGSSVLPAPLRLSFRSFALAYLPLHDLNLQHTRLRTLLLSVSPAIYLAHLTYMPLLFISPHLSISLVNHQTYCIPLLHLPTSKVLHLVS
ncbi:hypothetical protein BDY24DRAFT_387535 [Mrakia frigida]|uniref:uncharacterized protein n=1 Tax=Mrakia frigida TaxID=29902 RepID=UPI003FCBEE43